MWNNIVQYMDQFGIVVQFFILLFTGINLVISWNTSEGVEDLQEDFDEVNGD